jgi:hypothetical protein
VRIYTKRVIITQGAALWAISLFSCSAFFMYFPIPKMGEVGH